jgi:hypothetical protein
MVGIFFFFCFTFAGFFSFFSTSCHFSTFPEKVVNVAEAQEA